MLVMDPNNGEILAMATDKSYDLNNPTDLSEYYTEDEQAAMTEQELSEINIRKTGALLVAACQMGVAAAGGSELMLAAAGHYGSAIGMAFQIRDDMLDVLSTAEELGKPIGSDLEENKNTYMVLMGREGCEKTIAKLTDFAKNVLDEAFEDTAFLKELADALSTRDK